MFESDEPELEYLSEEEMELEMEFEDEEGEFVSEEEAEAEDEDAETELAAELLTVSNEDELDHFLGKLIRRAGRAARGILRTPAGRNLKALLRKAARRVLPVAGRAVGSYLGGARGGDIGSRLAILGGRAFGLELEGLSPEDQEFEIARRYVRMARHAARHAARHRLSGTPSQTARSAFLSAARQHAPGLIRSTLGRASSSRSHQSGRWVRRGRAIVLLGV